MGAEILRTGAASKAQVVERSIMFLQKKKMVRTSVGKHETAPSHISNIFKMLHGLYMKFK